MKIAIVTLVGNNYGNKFQNYAVERLLSNYGEVKTYRVADPVIAFTGRRKITLKKFAPSHICAVLRGKIRYGYDVTNVQRTLLGNLFYVLRNKTRLLSRIEERSKKFDLFSEKYLNVSQFDITPQNCNEENFKADYYFCGSDQVWNPTYAVTTDLAFLYYAPSDRAFSISASFGVSKIPDNKKENFTNWLNHLNKISVREEQGVNIVKELTGRDATLLLDPTMMLTSSDWLKISKKPQVELPKKFILTYFLGFVNKKTRKFIERQAKINNLEIVDLFNIEKSKYYTLDPSEVIYCIDRAEHIFTDSFHGSVFSILFHKNFTVFDRVEDGAKMTSRLVTLLDKFKLGKCWYNAEGINTIEDGQWEYAEKVLAIERQKFKEYLDSCFDR